MANNPGFGRYYAGNSILHRLDPRSKLAALALLFISLFSANSFIALVVLAIVLTLLWLALRIPLPTWPRLLLPLLLFAIFPFIFNVFYIADGETIFQWGIIRITDTGLYQGVFMALRLFMMFATATLLVLSTKPLEMANGIGRLLAPFERFGLPAYELSLMFSIALRFIPDIAGSFTQIRRAQQARGAVFDRGGPLRRLRALLPCLVPLFAQVFRHAEELALAMESRCYHGGNRRSYYRVMRFKRLDLIALLACLAISVTAIALRFMY